MRKVILIIILLFSLSLIAEEIVDIQSQLSELVQQKKYSEGATLLITYMKSNGESMDICYNVAFLYSLAEKKDQAFLYLDKCTDLGWSDVEWISNDQDFNYIRNDKRWKKIIAKVEKNLNSKLNRLPKEHHFLSEIVLPTPQRKSSVSLEETLQNRRSIREYANESLEISDVSQMLWSAYGITNVIAPEYLRGGLKTAPSAGGLYPLEIYLVVRDVKGLKAGIYYYEPNGHLLKLLQQGDFSQALSKSCYDQDYTATAQANIVYSAIYKRTTSKYGKRGRERYVCMDLGHSAENVYLQAEALGLGTCAIGAFNDLELRLLISMTIEEEPLYVMPIGKKIKQ